VVLLLSVGLGWFALKMREAERQRKAVEAIRAAHGQVFYDYEFDEEDILRLDMADPPTPAWLRRLVGDDFFADVVEAGFNVVSARRVDEAVLEHINGLPHLHSLDLCSTQVTDAALENLKGLTDLEILNLSRTHVTDAGVKHLKGLRNLACLDISGTQITDAGLEHLKGLSKLEYLRLQSSVDGTQAKDEGIEKLRKGLPNCEIILEEEDTQPVTDPKTNLAPYN